MSVEGRQTRPVDLFVIIGLVNHPRTSRPNFFLLLSLSLSRYLYLTKVSHFRSHKFGFADLSSLVDTSLSRSHSYSLESYCHHHNRPPPPHVSHPCRHMLLRPICTIKARLLIFRPSSAPRPRFGPSRIFRQTSRVRGRFCVSLLCTNEPPNEP
jgi:hypothetical protein